jgi:hypothetical protein
MSEHLAALQKAVISSFENMAFQEVSLIPENPMPAVVLRSFRQCRMMLFCPLEGTFSLTISPALLKTVSANVYGIDVEAVDAEMERDVLSELTNTIAGAWMRGISAPDQLYELGLPELIGADFIDIREAPIECSFIADNDFVDVSFFPVTPGI